LALVSAAVTAAPTVSSISGTVADDQVVTISGSGFGSNNMRVEWLGGTTGVIEQGATGGNFRDVRRTGWTEDLNPARFDTSNVYSGRKSLIFDSTAFGNDGRFGIHYDTGSNFTELYTSYAAYLDNRGVAQGQWKMMRYCFKNSVTDDSTPDMLLSNWTNGPGDMYTIFNGDLSTAADDRSIFMNNTLPPSMGWYRLEAYIRPSSQAGASDGELWVRTTRLSDGVQVGYARHTNVMTYNPGETKRYRYVIFQNYQGSGFGETGTRAWMDDVYVSQTQARVEICNASTWAACTKKEVQPPSSWSDGRITVKLNKGTLSSLPTSYLYVVDGTGAANANGYLVGIGLPAPAAPTNVSAH
jgi:hypothetical protein